MADSADVDPVVADFEPDEPEQETAKVVDCQLEDGAAGEGRVIALPSNERREERRPTSTEMMGELIDEIGRQDMQVDVPFRPAPTPAAAAYARNMISEGKFGAIDPLTGLPFQCNWACPVIKQNWESTTEEGKNLGTLHKFADRYIEEGDALKYSDEYLNVMQSATKGTLRIKTLSVQLMAKHGPIFPQHHRQTFEIMMTLTKDWWAVIRSYAVKGLPNVCVDENNEPIMEAVHTATERLLLFYHEHRQDREGIVVQESIRSLLRIDAQTLCVRLLTFLEGEGAEADARGESACRILKDWVMPHASEFLHPKPQVEEFIRTKVKKVLDVASEEEFKLLVDIIKDLKIFSQGGKYGVQGIADIVAEQAMLESTLDPSNEEELQRVLECVNIALPFYKRGAKDDKLSPNIARKILPVFTRFAGTPVQLLILRRLCELGPHVNKEAAAICLKPVYALLLQHLSRETAAEDETAPELAFNLIEGLLFLVHCYGYRERKGLIACSGIPLDGDSVKDHDPVLFKSFKNRVNATVKASEEMLVQLQGALPKVLMAGESDRALAVQTSLEQGIAAIRNISDLTKPFLSPKPRCTHDMPSGKFSWQIPKAAPKRVIEPASTMPLIPRMAVQPGNLSRQGGVRKGKVYEPPIRRPTMPRLSNFK